MHTIVAFALFSIAASPPPEWVKTGGATPRFPIEKFVTGFGEAADAEAAKTSAYADLAKKISVRIEQNVRDLSVEKDGQYRYEISAATAASTDVRITNMTYEVHADGTKKFALAYLDRGRFASDRRAERDRAIAELVRCAESAKKVSGEGALAAHLICRKLVSIATEQGTLARAVSPSKDDAKDKELLDTSRALDDRIAALFKSSAASASDAADTIALELVEQKIGAIGKLTVAPLTYGTSSFTSAFGQAMAVELERAIGAAAAKGGGVKRDVVVRGTFSEASDRVRVVITARDGATGDILGGASSSLPKSAVAKSTELLPPNLKDALAQEKVLGGGEIVSGKLRLDVSTNKGEKNLLFAAGEELKIYLRVNQPAYVRVIYLLASGAKVPIEQAYYLDASKVNQTVEYPSAFEVAAPFGVEQIYAVAFTEKPEPLQTTKQKIGGEEYDVISELGTLVKHRGLKKKKQGLETAEAVLSMTTTPK